MFLFIKQDFLKNKLTFKIQGVTWLLLLQETPDKTGTNYYLSYVLLAVAKLQQDLTYLLMFLLHFYILQCQC